MIFFIVAVGGVVVTISLFCDCVCIVLLYIYLLLFGIGLTYFVCSVSVVLNRFELAFSFFFVWWRFSNRV